MKRRCDPSLVRARGEAARACAALALAFAFASAPGCARTVGNGPDWDGGDARPSDGRAATLPDGARAPDASPPLDRDASANLDGEDPGPPAPNDDVVVPPPVDVPTLPDGAVDPTAPLVGTWRLVRFEFADEGAPARRVLTDFNTRFAAAMDFEVDARVNGTLFLEARRVGYTLGILANDHFFASDEATDAASALSTYGFSGRATLEGDRVVFPGGGGAGLAFRRNPDGTLAQTDADSGNVTTWARASLAPQPLDRFAARGRALWFGGAMAGPAPTLRRPRATLAWDVPESPSLVFTNDVPLSSSPLGYFEFPVSVRGEPPVVQALDRDGARVAVAYVLAYEDTNDSRAYEPGEDTLRGLSPVGLAWRAGPATPALAASPLRHCTTGYQLVSLHADFTASRRTAEPYDTARPVSPDVALAREVYTGELPELLR